MRRFIVPIAALAFFWSTASFAQDAVTLLKRAVQLNVEGKYAEAISVGQKALTAGEKALGSGHPAVGTLVGTLATFNQNAGRLGEAERLNRRALAIYEKSAGASDPNALRFADNLSFILLTQSRFREAEPYLTRVLAAREKTLGQNHVDVAFSLERLGSGYIGLERHSEAEQLFKRALIIRERTAGADQTLVASTLTSLGDVYLRQGRYREADATERRALAIREKAFGPTHVDVANSLAKIAWISVRQTQYAEAEPLYRRTLAIREKLLGADHVNVAYTLKEMGELYRLLARFDEAESLIKRALVIDEQKLGPNSAEVADNYAQLGAIFQTQGRYAEAESFQKRALPALEKARGADHLSVAKIVNNLANLSSYQGRLAEAASSYDRTIKTLNRVLGPEHHDTLTAQVNLGSTYARMGRFEDAEPILRRALTLREKTLGPNHPELAEALNQFVAFYRDQKRYGEALPYVERAISNGRPKSEAVLPVLLGAARSGTISLEKALDDGLHVVQKVAQTSASTAINKLSVRLAAGNDRLAKLVRQDQDLAAEADELDKSIIAAVSTASDKRDAAKEQRSKDRLAAVTTERAALQQVLAREFPQYSELSNPIPLTVRGIQSQLSDDEVLVAYTSGEKTSYVIAITREGFDWQTIPLGTEALSQKVAQFRQGLDVDAARESLSGGRPVLFDLGVAHDLYTALFEPVEAIVAAKKNLIVVPTGALTALPFHLLVTTKAAMPPPSSNMDAISAAYREANWLLRRQAVNVVPSVASIKSLRRGLAEKRPGKPLIGFGDPVFGPESPPTQVASASGRKPTRSFADFWKGAGVDRTRLSDALPRLSDTALELREVAKKVGADDQDVLLREAASEKAVKTTDLADYRIVYFATHGLVAGDVKGLAEPSLALTIPTTASTLDDGLLTASEIAQLKLNADWVVLSACNTIAGDKPGAEALSGLVRTFFYAGARALLVSHWAVDSAAATRLTTSTFDALSADPAANRAQALRRAMLDYMNDPSDPLNSNPAMWGPFALVGESGTPR